MPIGPAAEFRHRLSHGTEMAVWLSEELILGELIATEGWEVPGIDRRLNRSSQVIAFMEFPSEIVAVEELLHNVVMLVVELSEFVERCLGVRARTVCDKSFRFLPRTEIGSIVRTLYLVK